MSNIRWNKDFLLFSKRYFCSSKDEEINRRVLADLTLLVNNSDKKNFLSKEINFCAAQLKDSNMSAADKRLVADKLKSLFMEFLDVLKNPSSYESGWVDPKDGSNKNK